MRFATFRKLIMIEQTLFGLPWALSGMLLPIILGEITLDAAFLRWKFVLSAIAAFTAARTAGMCFNRYFDREIDAANPRTARRALPAKEIEAKDVLKMACAALMIFILSCFCINATVFALSFPVAVLVVLYSLTKRFTPLCHFVLGLIECFVPAMGWSALMGDVPAAPAWLLGLAVLFWIVGMDVIYALQDIQFDRIWRLHSIPASLGVQKSLWLARALHASSFACMVFLSFAYHFSVIYDIGLVFVACLFVIQHNWVKKGDVNQIRKAFFTCNSMIALVFFIFTLLTAVLG